MRKKTKTAKQIPSPIKAEKYYEKELLKYIEAMELQLLKKVAINDSSITEDILSFILGYTHKLPFSTIVEKFIKLVNGVNKKKFNHGLEAIGIEEIVNADTEAALEKARLRNVALVKSIPIKLHDRLEISLKKHFEGNSSKSLIEVIEKDFKVTKNRAKLIARDQTAKINHSITAQRATANGSIYYEWRTSRDERVRSQHKDLGGKEFTWEKGSPCCGHPSEEVNCRCTARAIYEV